MDMFALQPIQPAASIFYIQNLELAPVGWRHCVQKLAEGFSEIIGEHTYCLNCGEPLSGVQGHDASCVTMLARRILTNEPFLQNCYKITSAADNGTAAAGSHAAVNKPTPMPQTGLNVKPASYLEIPVFLPNA